MLNGVEVLKTYVLNFANYAISEISNGIYVVVMTSKSIHRNINLKNMKDQIKSCTYLKCVLS